ncbi:hypothetical protein JOF56_009830 [Kibdelosporangium banguiense]|uniref:DUF2236 domain-containing protein n=1 Tax=Kibdelosporangium banguiense TaxID=1365924 RepID=A0ABS4TYH7_9PSEU|nr:DUF6236 family protein [Kibdelosporangium banguiense]MBP2329445.1 hypothetical protein [Kibdelosporangium banguiense]
MVSGFGLYYPHVHFRDAAWLKNAALHWDRLDRFSADDAESTLPSLSQAEIELAAAGFIGHITPKTRQLERAGREFESVLADVNPGDRRQSPDEYDMANGVAAWKMSNSLVERLIDSGLGQLEHGRLRMNPTLAHAYLLVLGRQLARERGSCLVADNEFEQAASTMAAKRLVAGMLNQPNLPVSPEEQKVLLLNIAITTALPRGIDDIPPREIIRFREKYADRRVEFREAVTGMVKEATELEDIADRQILIDHLQARYDTRIRPKLEQLERAMRHHGWLNTTLGAVNIQAATPSVATGALALLAFQPPPAASAGIGLGAFALGVWRSARDGRRKREEILDDTPLSYLHYLSTDEQLTPSKLLGRVRTAAIPFRYTSRR